LLICYIASPPAVQVGRLPVAPAPQHYAGENAGTPGAYQGQDVRCSRRNRGGTLDIIFSKSWSVVNYLQMYMQLMHVLLKLQLQIEVLAVTCK